jgi:hypothetical protein
MLEGFEVWRWKEGKFRGRGQALLNIGLAISDPHF